MLSVPTLSGCGSLVERTGDAVTDYGQKWWEERGKDLVLGATGDLVGRSVSEALGPVEEKYAVQADLLRGIIDKLGGIDALAARVDAAEARRDAGGELSGMDKFLLWCEDNGLVALLIGERAWAVRRRRRFAEDLKSIKEGNGATS